jgi:uncharacterized protein (TIGR02145 family)
MKKVSLPVFTLITVLFLNILLLNAPAAGQVTKGTITDKRDKHVYGWVRIGNFSWLVNNLKFATPAGSWIAGNDSASMETYGRLYDWATAMKACPSGWHLPSDAEWANLIEALGGTEAAAGKLAEMDTIGRGGDFVGKHMGFVSFYGGVRHKDSTFSGINSWGGYWSSTFIDNDNASNYLIVHGSNGIGKSSNSKAAGFLVRCVRKK